MNKVNMTDSQSKSREIQSYQNGETTNSKTVPRDQETGISNEYVLNVAFWTFLGFLLLEAVFALIANSQSMLEDAEAMSVDALTYLFNLCAERVKHRPYTAKELEMPEAVREYKMEMTRLYLEVVPPLISVTTLVAVTVYAVNDAVESLCQPEEVPEEDVDVSIMMWFSGANLLLDLVNVTCFARAGQAFGIATLKRETAPTRFSMRGNGSTLAMQIETQQLMSVEASESGESDVHVGQNLLVNLNMCSAWTHICADTFRSTAVLVAASISMTWPESVPGDVADSMATIIVSLIILVSLLPLLHRIYATSRQIITLSTDPMRPVW